MQKIKIVELNDFEIQVSAETHNTNYHNLITGIVKTTGGRITGTQWQNKYNSFIVQDNKPFSTVGFNEVLTITFKTKEHKEFTNKLLCDIIDRIEKFENEYNMEAIVINGRN